MAGILNSRIFIEKGDITEMQVDAIVNAANKEWCMRWRRRGHRKREAPRSSGSATG